MAESTNPLVDRLEGVKKELELIKHGLHILSGANSGYLQGEEIFALFKDLCIPKIKECLEEFLILSLEEADAYYNRGGLSWITDLGPYYLEKREEILKGGD